MANSTIWQVVSAIFIVLVIHKIWTLQKALKCVSHVPGRQFLWIDPFQVLSVVFGSTFPWAGRIGHYSAKFSLYEKYGSTCLSAVRLWNSQIYYWIADADALKTVTSDRHTFQKDVEAYEVLNIYGENMVGTEGADWKRHRAVAKPAFNEANNTLVWSETIRIVNEWISYLESEQPDVKNSTITIDVLPALTQVTLLIISSAGFGRSVSWASDTFSPPPAGHTLTFRGSVISTLDNIYTKILTPTWLIYLSSVLPVPLPYISRKLRETEMAFAELRSHIVELVSHMRADVASGKKSEETGLKAALLRNLVEANMTQDDDYKSLTDDELLSNIFTFLLAGHETSAHTLSFALPLLAVYPDVQRRIFEEVLRLWPQGCPAIESNSSYKDDFAKLEYTTAFFRETLRMFPSEPRLAKQVHADATITARRFVPHAKGPDMHGEVEQYRIAIQKGSVVIMDVFGTNLNPLHWGQDAAEFKPERFIDTDTYRWPRDAFLTFSAGARGCIGSRFAMTESVCILALLVRQYAILVPSNLESRSKAEQRNVLLKWTTGVTITPTNSRVRLRRRS